MHLFLLHPCRTDPAPDNLPPVPRIPFYFLQTRNEAIPEHPDVNEHTPNFNFMCPTRCRPKSISTESPFLRGFKKAAISRGSTTVSFTSGNSCNALSNNFKFFHHNFFSLTLTTSSTLFHRTGLLILTSKCTSSHDFSTTLSITYSLLEYPLI